MRTVMALALLMACNGKDEEGLEGDGDGDGWTVAAGDCDDNDASVSPGADEVWYDGIDQDCDGRDDDQDEDGAGIDTDCDDEDPKRAPGNAEIVGDGVDQDCGNGDAPALSATDIAAVPRGARLDSDSEGILLAVADYATGEQKGVIHTVRYTGSNLKKGSTFSGLVESSGTISVEGMGDVVIGADINFGILAGSYTDAGDFDRYLVLIGRPSGDDVFWVLTAVYSVDPGQVHLVIDDDGDVAHITAANEKQFITTAGSLEELYTSDGTVASGGSDGNAVARDGILWTIDGDTGIENTVTGFSVTPTGTEVDDVVQMYQDNDVLAFVHSDSIEFRTDSGTETFDVSGVTAIRVDKVANDDWLVLATNDKDQLTLYRGALDSLEELTSYDKAVDDFDVEGTKDGYILVALSGDTLEMGRAVTGGR